MSGQKGKEKKRSDESTEKGINKNITHFSKKLFFTKKMRIIQIIQGFSSYMINGIFTDVYRRIKILDSKPETLSLFHEIEDGIIASDTRTEKNMENWF